MAKSKKSANTPARPRAKSAKKAAPAAAAAPAPAAAPAKPKQKPTREQIGARAHQIWIEEGRPEGRSLDHWFRAERELGA